MNMTKEACVIGAVLLGVICFAVGVSLGANYLGTANHKSWFDFLSMIGSWVAGIGALVAVVVALSIAERQAKLEHNQDAIRCVHHALAVINDLRGRVGHLKIMLVDGGRPLLALKKSISSIERRYESLYDRDIYRHAPSDLVDLITSLSGTFFGLSVHVDAFVSSINLKPQDILPKNTSSNAVLLEKTLAMLDDELNTLFDQFSRIRSELPQ